MDRGRTVANYMPNNVSILLQCGPLGGEQNESVREVVVSPNPTSGKFFVEVGDCVNGQIIVTDLIGQTIYQVTYTNSRGEVDLSLQPNGIYFVSVISEGETSMQKIVVQK